MLLLLLLLLLWGRCVRCLCLLGGVRRGGHGWREREREGRAGGRGRSVVFARFNFDLEAVVGQPAQRERRCSPPPLCVCLCACGVGAFGQVPRKTAGRRRRGGEGEAERGRHGGGGGRGGFVAPPLGGPEPLWPLRTDRRRPRCLGLVPRGSPWSAGGLPALWLTLWLNLVI